MGELESKKILSELTGKKNIYYVSKGRLAAEILIDILPKREILLQEEGSWHTYPKLGDVLYLKMIDGKINVEDIQPNKILLINTMPAYAWLEDAKKVYEACKQKKTIMINDVCGSIGKQQAKYGDYIIGSFGRWKPITIGQGGFIATNEDLNVEEVMLDEKALVEALKNIPKKLVRWEQKKQEVLKLIKKQEIIAHEINILTKRTETLINLLEKNNIEYELCPKYIRTMKQAISIEIKRW
ncbi:MAG: hypothetical protein ACMXX9_03170 [Candidatus Woesearchaeota archaeon]